jgi:two-component system phosphate regulon sensor histidine kinase PhoR
MSDLMQQEAKRLLSFLLLAGLIGWFIGHPAWAMLLGLSSYTFLHLRNIEKLYRWLRENPEADVPEAHGAWEDILNRIHTLRRDERRARDGLLSIIERARTSVSALKEAVVMIDGKGNLEWWNPAAERLLGLKTPADSGQPVTNLIRNPVFCQYFEQGPYDAPLLMPSEIAAGHHLQFEITRFGKNDRLMIVDDVTRLHNLEQMRKDFVANVSHELRTPLTVLSGYLETLLDNGDAVPSRWQRALQQMDAQTGRMNNLVNDLLLLSRLENENTAHDEQRINLPALLDQIRNEALAFGHDKHHTITLECDAGVTLMGREANLRSAFSNLVTNAVKYTPAQGCIHIRWRADAQHGYFSVNDNGIGIDAHHIPRLTERFYRADAARSTATGGTGLGLAIVKHVLLQHQAQLDIQSRVGKGSTFTCIFPATAVVR